MTIDGTGLNDGDMLIVDDNDALREQLSRAMNKRGFKVFSAESLNQARQVLKNVAPTYAVVDMKLDDGNGLDFVKEIRSANDDAKVVIMTGYGNIATAVAAIKHGAVDYLPKPTDVDAIINTLLNQNSTFPKPPVDPMSPDRVRWEHIQRVFAECDNNVSETARRLKMHRRTLQRILAKHAPKS